MEHVGSGGEGMGVRCGRVKRCGMVELGACGVENRGVRCGRVELVACGGENRGCEVSHVLNPARAIMVGIRVELTDRMGLHSSRETQTLHTYIVCAHVFIYTYTHAYNMCIYT